MNHRLTQLFTGLLLAVLSAGCIPDTRYDLSKLDTEMTLLKGKEFPVPDFSFRLGDLFDLDGFGFITSEDGDYIIQVDLDPLDLQVRAQDIRDDGMIPAGFQPLCYRFGDLPDFLSGADRDFIVPDLSDMLLSLRVHSTLPGSFTAGCTFQTILSESVTHTYYLSGMQVSSGFNQFDFRENPVFAGDIRVPELGKLLNPFPDAIRVNSLDLQADPWLKDQMDPSAVYDLTFLTHAEAPICLAPDQRFTVQIPLDAQLDLEQVGLKKAVLMFSYENTIPLDFSVGAHALDAEGNRIDGIRITATDPIRANSIQMSSLELTTDGDLRFNQLVLELTISSTAQTAGMHINQGQYIRFTQVSLYLPDGITIRLDESAQ